MKTPLPGLGGSAFAPVRQPFLNVAALVPPRAPDHFFSAGRIIHSVATGDTLPVYMQVGDTPEETKVLSEVLCDFNRLGGLFRAAHDISGHFEQAVPHVRTQIAPNMDAMMVMRMTGIFMAMELLMVPSKGLSLKQRQKRREAIYKNASLVDLSKIAQAGLVECVEKSALAKHWLGQKGYNMMMINHAFRFASKSSEGMMHSMLGILQREHVLLFDPNNAMTVNGALNPAQGAMIDGKSYVPSLYQVPRERWERLLTQGKTGPAMIDLSTDSVWLHASKPEKAWFGFGLPDQTLTPEAWLVPARPADSQGLRPVGP